MESKLIFREEHTICCLCYTTAKTINMFWRIGPVMGSLVNFGELNINIKRSTQFTDQRRASNTKASHFAIFSQNVSSVKG